MSISCMGMSHAQELSQLLEAAKQGSFIAKKELASRFYSGTGGAIQNPRMAMKYLNDLAEKGDLDALLTLGYMHGNGVGTSVDLRNATSFYEKAALLGSDEAFEWLAYVAEQRYEPASEALLRLGFYYPAELPDPGQSLGQLASGQEGVVNGFEDQIGSDVRTDPFGDAIDSRVMEELDIVVSKDSIPQELIYRFPRIYEMNVFQSDSDGVMLFPGNQVVLDALGQIDLDSTNRLGLELGSGLDLPAQRNLVAVLAERIDTRRLVDEVKKPASKDSILLKPGESVGVDKDGGILTEAPDSVISLLDASLRGTIMRGLNGVIDLPASQSSRRNPIERVRQFNEDNPSLPVDAGFDNQPQSDAVDDVHDDNVISL